jgi:high-affinity nickel-transport protein
MKAIGPAAGRPAGYGTGRKVATLYALLLLFQLACWGWALLAFRSHPLLLGTALLAYSLGLRHAVDADHIAAIDNVTRKLMQNGGRPLAVGLLFSLGHSTVVLLGSMAIAGTASSLGHRAAAARHIGGMIGTAVSTFFLLGIGVVNLAVLRSVSRAFLRVRRGEPYGEEDLDLLLGNRGFLARLLRPVLQAVNRSWHMYPLGILFGLGFDTATEVGLLGISAVEASKGLSMWSVLVFPALFTAGMALVDTTDNVLMLGAYGWAFVKPVRKLYYNLTVTAFSVMVAFAIGGIEALGMLSSQLHLRGRFWDLIAALNGRLGLLGYGVILLFGVSWAVSIAIYRWRRFDSIPVKASA